MDIKQIVKNLNLRFTSGNSVPVERAHISRSEYEILIKYLEISQMNVLDRYDNRIQQANIVANSELEILHSIAINAGADKFIVMEIAHNIASKIFVINGTASNLIKN